MHSQVDSIIDELTSIDSEEEEIVRRPGRPRSGYAKSNAERQREYRKKHKQVETGTQIAATINRLSKQFELTEQQVTRELLRFALCNKNWSKLGFPQCAKEVVR